MICDLVAGRLGVRNMSRPRQVKTITGVVTKFGATVAPHHITIGGGTGASVTGGAGGAIERVAICAIMSRRAILKHGV